MNCPNGHGPLIRGSKYWLCEECQYRILILESGQASRPEKLSPLIGLLPSILAIPLRDYTFEIHPVMKLHRLCDALEITVRFLTIVSLAELRRILQGASLPENVLQVLQSRIERPTFAQWRDMLEVLTRSIQHNGDLVVPELPSFALEQLLPLLPGGDALPERCVISLRNDLVHGGGMASSVAHGYLKSWSSKINALLESVQFLHQTNVCVLRHDHTQRLIGASIEGEVSKTEPASHWSSLAGHVVLLKEDQCLDLWPLCEYGLASAVTIRGLQHASAESPMVYFRFEREKLLYAALGVDLARAEKQDVVEAFRDLFRLQTRVHVRKDEVLDFEEEVRKEAASLVGRLAEIRRVKQVLKQHDSGVFWISGPGGIGKSMLMAKVALDLGNDPKRSCRIFWRFKTGDGVRCNRYAFFRHVFASLRGWMKKGESLIPQDPDQLMNEIAILLDEVAKAPANGDKPSPRILFMLDGLDEVERIDVKFPHIPFQMSYPHVLWLCAGRPERTLPAIFTSERCIPVFPSGLPKTSENDIRAMLIDGVDSLKYTLLLLDQERPRVGSNEVEVANPAVQAVVDRADGLPLYVHFVVSDILSGQFHFAQLSQSLPPSLDAYYDELLRRLSIGDLQALLTPLLVTIAWARSPLDEETLLLLMSRRKMLLDGEAGRLNLKRGLEAIQSMIRLAPTPNGNVGYEPYHPTFREHIRTDHARMLSQQNALALQEFCRLTEDWCNLPTDHPALDYSLRFGPRHLMEAGLWERVESLLTDFSFLEAKCKREMTFDLVGDYQEYHALRGAGTNKVEEFGRFLQSQAHILATYPTLYLQQAANQPDDSNPSTVARSVLEKDPQGSLWIEWINKPQKPDPSVMTLSGHSLGVSSCVFLKNGKQIVSGSLDDKLKVWDAQTGLEISTLKGHSSAVFGCAVSPDGQQLVSASWDKTLKVWDTQSWKELKTLKGHSNAVSGCAFSPNGAWLASVSWDRTVKIWDTGKWEAVATLEGHSNSVYACAFSPDSTRIVSGSADSTVRVWETETWKEIKVIAGHSKSVNTCLYSPDGKWIASGSLDNSVRIWDASSFQEITALTNHTSSVLYCSCSPDGSKMLSGSQDKSMKVWNTQTWQEIVTLTGHLKLVLACVFAPDNKRILSASGDHTLKLWNMETYEKQSSAGTHTGSVFGCAFSPDGRSIVTGSWDGTLKLWDLAGQERNTFTGHSEGVMQCAYSSDGKYVASASWDRTLKIWDVQEATEIKTLSGHTGPVYCCAFSPDGSRMASGSGDRTLRLWDVISTSRQASILKGHKNPIYYCDFSPDGLLLASASFDKTVSVWDVQELKEITTLAAHNDWVYACRFSPDGRQMVTASKDKSLILWDTKTWQPVRTLSGHTSWVFACAYSGDGKNIISGSGDKTVRIWDVSTGKPVATFFAGVSVYSVTTAGKFIAAGDGSGKLHILRPRGFQAARITTILNKQNAFTARCPSCCDRFPVSQRFIDLIVHIRREQGISGIQIPLGQLPAELRENQQLLAECPLCRQPLRFNPVVLSVPEAAPVSTQFEEETDPEIDKSRDFERLQSDTVKKIRDAKSTLASGILTEQTTSIIEAVLSSLKGTARMGSRLKYASAQMARTMFDQRMVDYLMHKANQAAANEEWDTAIDVLKEAIKNAQSTSRYALRECLAGCVANRALKTLSPCLSQLSSGLTDETMVSQFIFELEKTERDLLEIIGLQPPDNAFVFLFEEAQQLFGQGRVQQALETALRISQSFSGYNQVRVFIAECYSWLGAQAINNGRALEALEHLRKAEKLRPGDPRIFEAIQSAYWGLSIQFWDQNRFDEALQSASQISPSFSGYDQAKQMMAGCLHKKAESAVEQKNFPAALEYLKRAHELLPEETTIAENIRKLEIALRL